MSAIIALCVIAVIFAFSWHAFNEMEEITGAIALAVGVAASYMWIKTYGLAVWMGFLILLKWGLILGAVMGVLGLMAWYIDSTRRPLSTNAHSGRIYHTETVSPDVGASTNFDTSYNDVATQAVAPVVHEPVYSNPLVTERPIVQGAASGHLEYHEGETGVTYDALFAAHLDGVTRVTLIDPYIRAGHQFRNLREFSQTLVHNKGYYGNVSLHLKTSTTSEERKEQYDHLCRMRELAATHGVLFTWDIEDGLHARSVTTDTGWKISLDRGLDIYQSVPWDTPQAQRPVKSFDITYIALT